MRPVTSRLAVLSAALLLPLASVEAAARSGGGHAQAAFHSGHAKGHIGARSARGFGYGPHRGGWQQGRVGHRHGRDFGDRNGSFAGYDRSGSHGYGYGGYGFAGGYGYGYGATGYGYPGIRSGALPGRPFVGDPSGLPVAPGIPSPPVQPPAIYVVGSGVGVGKGSVRVRRSGGAITAGSEDVGAGGGVVVSGPRLSRLR